MEETRFVHATFDKHGERILEIFNEAILNSTAIFEYVPRTIEVIKEWFEAKEAKGYPIIAMETLDGTLVGFATYMGYRDKPAYKYSVEHSLYVAREYRGQGYGRRLLSHLIKVVEGKGCHLMVGGVVTSNRASAALHEALGFELVGTVKDAGYKFGSWESVTFYQMIFPGPARPIEG